MPGQAPSDRRDDTAAGDLPPNLGYFTRHLRTENVSRNTMATYTSAVGLLTGFLVEQGMATDVAKVRREHVEAFIEDMLGRWKPATAHNRFRGCQRSWRDRSRRTCGRAGGREEGAGISGPDGRHERDHPGDPGPAPTATVTAGRRPHGARSSLRVPVLGP
jgi:hypothetical protein